jgi:hypothetical protein
MWTFGSDPGVQAINEGHCGADHCTDRAIVESGHVLDRADNIAYQVVGPPEASDYQNDIARPTGHPEDGEQYSRRQYD